MKKEIYQYTIKKPATLTGVGLHTGRAAKLTVHPAKAGHGIRFKQAGARASVPAHMDRVVDTGLATTIADKGMVFSTTEHLMAALAGLGIDNALIELDGPELPIMDGSAGPFVSVLRSKGRKRLKRGRSILKIVREVVWNDGDREVRAVPYEGLKLTCEIEFNHALIRNQSYTVEISPERFAEEIAGARTFGFLDQVEKLQQNGYALGGSLENAVVIDDNGVINKEGLRFSDEFVRHKILDLLGDLALLGCPLQGHIIARKSGHEQHLRFMKTLAAHPECWQVVEIEPDHDSEKGFLEKLTTTTREAGNRILPFLTPESEEIPCPSPA